MKEIQLTQRQVALVDDDMYEDLNQFNWSAHKRSNVFYAKRNSPRINGKRYMIFMHHLVIGFPPKGLVTDHKNGCGTDNRQENLRFVTQRQNLQNLKNIKKSSIYPGIYWEKRVKKWHAHIKINGKCKSLGRFTDELAAFKAYESAVTELGERML